MTFAGWTEDSAGLHRDFRFRDFAQAWTFMSRVADLAERLNHHPDWSNRWNQVAITLISYDVGRVTDRDTFMAGLIDELAAQVTAEAS